MIVYYCGYCFVWLVYINNVDLGCLLCWFSLLEHGFRLMIMLFIIGVGLCGFGLLFYC